MVRGAPLAVSGVVTAYTGFSGLTMNINLPAGFLITVWIIALGVYGRSRNVDEFRLPKEIRVPSDYV